MALRTFEFDDGQSRKFWRIRLDGSSHTVSYGRIGTNGQTRTREFSSDEKARASHDRLIAEPFDLELPLSRFLGYLVPEK